MKSAKRVIAVMLCFCIIFSYMAVNVNAASMGDVNGDGKILTDDARDALRCATFQGNLSIGAC